MNPEVIDQFLKNAEQAAAGTKRLTGSDALEKALAELLPKDASVYCPAVSDLERAAAGFLGETVADYALADVCVEEVAAAIAETGSLVVTSAGGRAVQASLLPARHVALLPAEKVHATLDDYLAEAAADPPTNITFITGPSRTADIELTLSIGVHGPERLDILVF